MKPDAEGFASRRSRRIGLKRTGLAGLATVLPADVLTGRWLRRAVSHLRGTLVV